MNLKNKYTDYILKDNISKKETMTEARKRIVQDILEIWKGKDINNNKEYIPASLIIKSFKITGISNSNDGTEDYLFDGYDVINNLNILNEQNKESQNFKDMENIQDDIKADKNSLDEGEKIENNYYNDTNNEDNKEQNENQDDYIEDEYEFSNESFEDLAYN